MTVGVIVSTCICQYSFVNVFCTFSWRMALPFYTKLPFADVIRTRENINLMNEVVYNIIKTKRSLLESGRDGKLCPCSGIKQIRLLSRFCGYAVFL